MRAYWMILAVLLAACGADLEDPTPWKVEDGPPAEDGVVEEALPDDIEACAENADCADGEYCHRPAACGAERYCVEGHAPLSAAPPDPACSCSGMLTAVNAGYPGPHAWRLGNLGGWAGDSGPCDPDASSPFNFTIRYRLPDDLEIPAGATPVLHVDPSLETEERFVRMGTDGTAQIQATGDQWVDFGSNVLFDLDGDGECSEGEQAYWAYVEEKTVDFVTFEVDATLVLIESDEPCEAWD